MFENEYILNVDLKRKFTAIVPTFVQNDTASLVFRIFDNGKEFDLSDYTRAEMTTVREDGQVVIGRAEIEVVDDKQQIRYEYMGNEMSVDGFADTSLTIFSAEDRVTVRPFKIHIVADVRDAVGATEEYGIFQELIAEVNGVLDRAERGENERESNEDNRVEKEKSRVSSEEAREENETERVQNESVRESSEQDRESQEQARISEESSRQSKEEERRTSESQREESESERVGSETERESSEQERIASEESRVTNENAREASEAIREESEDSRVAAETDREQAETDRMQREDSRESSESARVASEESRETSETARESSEQSRATSESEREQSETIRKNSETEREQNENKRQLDTQEAIENAETATSEANEASQRAEDISDNFKHVGEYDNSATYYQGNEVRVNGSSFIALKETAGNSPPNAQDRSNEWWELRALRGVDGLGSVVTVNGISPDADGDVDLGDIDGGMF